jgi:hypothetical protein
MKVYRQFVERPQLLESKARLGQVKSLIRRDPSMAPTLQAEVNYHTAIVETCKRQRLLVQPGNSHPEVAEWRSLVSTPGGIVQGARMITVDFIEGCAEVDNKLGDYLIESGEAFKRPQPVLHAGDY